VLPRWEHNEEVYQRPAELRDDQKPAPNPPLSRLRLVLRFRRLKYRGFLRQLLLPLGSNPWRPGWPRDLAHVHRLGRSPSFGISTALTASPAGIVKITCLRSVSPVDNVSFSSVNRFPKHSLGSGRQMVPHNVATFTELAAGRRTNDTGANSCAGLRLKRL
jgi:hypothetical protein